MLEAEMDEHLCYEPYQRTDSTNVCNGNKQKTIRSRYGETVINVPQDRESSFEPKIVKKRQKDISGIDDKIISMYAKGMTTRQISEQIEDILCIQGQKTSYERPLGYLDERLISEIILISYSIIPYSCMRIVCDNIKTKEELQ